MPYSGKFHRILDHNYWMWIIYKNLRQINGIWKGTKSSNHQQNVFRDTRSAYI